MVLALFHWQGKNAVICKVLNAVLEKKICDTWKILRRNSLSKTNISIVYLWIDHTQKATQKTVKL